jgi:hypothetical protein
MKPSARVFARLTPLTAFILFVVLPPAQVVVAQQTDQDQQSSDTVCTFDDGRQISARYSPVAVDRSESPPIGRVWIPGGSAVTLFTDTEVTVGNTPIPTGAYTIYLIPGKRDWTLVVSKNVTLGSKYNEQQDLVRAAMETGTLSRAEAQLKIFFGHTGPKQCELNVDYGKIRAWVEFREK